MNVGVYRIYNYEVGKEGEPFYMCDKHYKEWSDNVGYKFIVNKIADNATRQCENCNE